MNERSHHNPDRDGRQPLVRLGQGDYVRDLHDDDLSGAALIGLFLLAVAFFAGVVIGWSACVVSSLVGGR